jgi:16S rRNA G966 N2-methylase RsmD
MNDYTSIRPIDHPIAAQRQTAKRHYGVHPYFTRRPFNVIRDYLLRFSKERDCVVDPFGGSGVTAIEAFLENRAAIHNDINPLANFIAQGIARLSEGEASTYKAALGQLKAVCQPRIVEIEESGAMQLAHLQARLPLPENVRLPANSDAEYYRDLFTPRQLAALAVLKTEIEKISDEHARAGMLLAWSATLTKLNRTFLSAKGRAASRGGSSIFSIYRYKLAKEPVELPAWPTFEERAKNVIAAKQEIDYAIRLKSKTSGWYGTFEVRSQDVEELSRQLAGKVDYIFTDPPYGGHISYLDLSTLWNNWLGLMPTREARQKEVIVGGELRHTEEEYLQRLRDSIRACVRMLKRDRWLSVVFQHWNVAYFEAILSAAAEAGAELKAAVAQVGDPIWSMHKKKNKESVLAGEMILTFCKTGMRLRREKRNGFDLAETVSGILSSLGADTIYGEYLFNRVVIDAWNKGAIDSLSITKNEFTELIESLGWRYDAQRHYWHKGRSAQGVLFENFETISKR